MKGKLYQLPTEMDCLMCTLNGNMPFCVYGNAETCWIEEGFNTNKEEETPAVKQYIIHYDYYDENNVAHTNKKVTIYDKNKANEIWLKMKTKGNFFNMRAETKEPTRHVVQVEFIKGTNPYTYETTLAVKKGSWLVVEANGQKKVVQAISDDHDEPEEELAKKFDISKIKKVFGVVKTK